jgi:rhamnosyltransferase
VFEVSNIGVAYGRQLPRNNAQLIEAHARLFNYPDVSQIRTFEMKDEFGVKTAFTSNSFSAYRVSALRQVGGFPLHTIVSEDMYVAAKMLKAGWSIAYCAESKVYHSHNYTLSQEFKRYFDIGVFNSRESWIMAEFGGAESEGFKFIKSEVLYLLNHNPFLVFESVIRSAVKYAGYKFGKNEKRLPAFIKKIMSSQSYYWETN